MNYSDDDGAISNGFYQQYIFFFWECVQCGLIEYNVLTAARFKKSQTSMVLPLEFLNGYLISSHTL